MTIVTARRWRALCERYDNRCLCCNQQVPLERDHIVARVRGGPHTMENLQPLCRSCNSLKGTKTIDYRPKPDRLPLPPAVPLRALRKHPWQQASDQAIRIAKDVGLGRRNKDNL